MWGRRTKPPKYPPLSWGTMKEKAQGRDASREFSSMSRSQLVKNKPFFHWLNLCSIVHLTRQFLFAIPVRSGLGSKTVTYPALILQATCLQRETLHLQMWVNEQSCARYIKVGSAIPIQDTGSVSKVPQNRIKAVGLLRCSFVVMREMSTRGVGKKRGKKRRATRPPNEK